jgi:hypothetical protein
MTRARAERIFVTDAHRYDGKRFVVRADEKLTAFLRDDTKLSAVFVGPNR